MEIELIQDGKVVDYNKYQEVIENVKESLFRRNMDKETKEWMYISNFVGILLDKDRLILSLPKSVIIKEDVDKEILLYKYARLFDLYFVVNEKKCDLINKYESIENWCKKTIEENKTIIGIGAGAVTKLITGDTKNRTIERLINPKDPLMWIDELEERMEKKKERIREAINGR